jgi:hypothetical protein
VLRDAFASARVPGGPHQIRVTAAKLLLERGYTLLEVAAFLRWAATLPAFLKSML